MTNQEKKKSTILIVDDNFINMNMLLEFLNQQGYKTLIAQDGETAIRRAEIGRPDLILLDILMAGMDGFETCQKLKTIDTTRDIPVIFLTALTDTVNQMKGFEVGGVDYITKPFDPKQVLSCIKKQIKIKEQKAELTELTPSISDSTDARDRFFSIIVHKMSKAFNQLHDLSIFFSDAISELQNDEIIVFDRHMFGSARNTINILENILDWGRLQQNAWNVQPEKIDLYGIFLAVFYAYQKLARTKNINICHSIQPELFVQSDPEMTYRILANIIVLTLVYPSSEKIIVSADKKNGYVAINIKHTVLQSQPIGNSLDSKDLLKTLNTGDALPLQLTLALCHKMLVMNNGSLSMLSDNNQNSYFEIRLPTSN
jgi:DNA-binding response OmpR family regulator